MELIYTFVVLKETKNNKVTEFQGTPTRICKINLCFI